MRVFLKQDKGSVLVNPDHIVKVDYSALASDLTIVLHLTDGQACVLTDLDAIEAMMQLHPAAIEGRRLRFARHAWAFHNLVGHPMLQLAAWFKQHKLGFWFHDVTVPRPRKSKHGVVSRGSRLKG